MLLGLSASIDDIVQGEVEEFCFGQNLKSAIFTKYQKQTSITFSLVEIISTHG